jgi:hypothetical protein
MFEIRHLLILIDAYKANTGLPDTTVSSRVFCDGKKITALRAGADLTTGRFNAAVKWFAENWPANARWPSDVPLIAKRSASTERAA